MKTIIASIQGVLLFLVAGGVNAAPEKDDNRPPTGCHDKGYQFKLKTLHLFPGDKNDNQSLYLMYNGLNQPITLYQMRNEESSRSTYLNHSIGAGEWAVLSTNEKRVKFACTIPDGKSAYGQMVDCSTSLRICEYTNVRYGLNNRGNYWLVNSNSRNGAVSAVVRYGIIPGQ
ncbi:hypothetical protein [Legionella fairfieldensis]|uniref:hypothetical protein n=1 Tax=Legionella fairfieldensis TaxID=45064 RepID=UPI00048A6CAB|nr:hypothetical protein [Legionella fairfieldensis]